MRLMIKQRVFSWSDTYDVYDEDGKPKYYVQNEIFSLLHRIHVEDMQGNEIGTIKQDFTFIFPRFEIEIGGRSYGSIEKQFCRTYLQGAVPLGRHLCDRYRESEGRDHGTHACDRDRCGELFTEELDEKYL